MPTTVFSPYCHTMALSLCRTSMIRSLPWSVISMFPPGRNVFWTGVLSWLNPNPVTPKVPYCQMMLPLWSTRRTLLSTQPLLQFVVAPGGIPVPDISVRLPTRSASFVPTIALAEVSPGPFPNCQTILPAGSISMTRLLNWSVMRMLPGRLNSLELCPFATVPDNKMTPPINNEAAIDPNGRDLFMVHSSHVDSERVLCSILDECVCL